MRTPMKVARMASRRVTARQAGATRRIACQANARANIEAHISPRAPPTRPGREARRLVKTRSRPIRPSAIEGQQQDKHR